MHIVLLLCGIVISIIVFFIGLFWVLVIFAPAYVFVAVFLFYTIRRRRLERAQQASLAIDAEVERQLNEREYRAWQQAVDEARDRDERRNRQLKRFDSTRE